jgi:hypothetical protein
MNEQLLDICIKAGINTWPFNEVGFISLDESELVKFAELIVRECAQAMMDYGKTYAHPSAGEYQSNEFSKVIKQHFGVEE